MDDFDTMFTKFFCIISFIALIISFSGLVVFLKTLLFCIKRYISSIKGIPSALSTLRIDKAEQKTPLSAADIVTKTILKEHINKFARDTLNTVKSNNYLTERKEDAIDPSYKEEMERLNDIYISLDKMPIENAESLEEVNFLFNNGRLRQDSEIIEFYKVRQEKEEQSNYRKEGFVYDALRTYQESEISTKLIMGLASMFVSFMYFYYKVCMEDVEPWRILDIPLFIIGVIRVLFSPYYDACDNVWIFTMDRYAPFEFSLSLILSVLIAFLLGMGAILVVGWSSNLELHKIYSKAGEKKKPDIILGVNTASYLYVLHKLLKRRK